ncbi:uncharacterized protein LOC124454747 [Xenia sp. Carnegie-2017]|uniref:uncharacterized protein LOC124454747 n=1 Tax=Xenia sp. Carnegie-2017 TaxID=2897299 RepID=UPI001F0503E8|nr:uncharacterized protein LOC124454747 [Xenia sp. Carnegie-2017]XP_046861469.1 uncharacterized protein LOC124454747 [Xenia sp. Carnegie-2017]
MVNIIMGKNFKKTFPWLIFITILCICLKVGKWKQNTYVVKSFHETCKSSNSSSIKIQVKSNHQNKRFIYLIQTESCLLDNLLNPQMFGHKAEHDVLVLSWKSMCSATQFSTPSYNISYIFRPGTTWSSGRNILYELAMNSSQSYLYYIFLDGDLSYHFSNSDFEKTYRQCNTSLEMFEYFLLKYEPAIGVPFYCPRPTIQGQPLCYYDYKIFPFREVIPVSIYFDAAFNAFHKDAIKSILPYRLIYEKESWWESQKFVILAADIIFRGQVLTILPVATANIMHRKYPRDSRDNWNDIYDMLLKETPKEYRIIKEFKPSYTTVSTDPVVRNDTVYTPYMHVEIPKGRINVEPYKRFKH